MTNKELQDELKKRPIDAKLISLNIEFLYKNEHGVQTVYKLYADDKELLNHATKDTTR